jgi:type III pantothenate kinase
MLLVIDVGNTQSVVGVYKRFTLSEAKSAKPLAKWRFSTQKSNAIHDIIATILPLFGYSSIKTLDIDQVVLASVVPTLTQVWEGVARELFGVQALRCDAISASKAGLFDADYPTPEEIGADRVADAIAARALFGAPCVVVDFGTATNMEVLDARGYFVGGVLAPGMLTGASALTSAASRLGAVEMSAPAHVIGKSSAEAMRSGILLGEAARTDGLLEAIFNELKGNKYDEGKDHKNAAAPSVKPCPSANKPFAVATGGLAETIAPHCKLVDAVEPDLTLIGLCLLADAS